MCKHAHVEIVPCCRKQEAHALNIPPYSPQLSGPAGQGRGLGCGVQQVLQVDLTLYLARIWGGNKEKHNSCSTKTVSTDCRVKDCDCKLDFNSVLQKCV